MPGSMEMRQEKIFYSEAAFEGIARQVLCEYDEKAVFLAFRRLYLWRK